MSSVIVRKRDLKDGRKSLYLDIYHNGKSQHKTLKLFLEKGTSKEVKELNQKTSLIADKVRMQVLQQIVSGDYGNKDKIRSYTWAEWFAILTKERYNSGKNYNTWRSVYKHLKSFLKNDPDFLLSNVNVTELERFKTHLLSQVSQNSSASYFDVMKYSIHEAFRRKLIKDNPATDLKSVKYQDPHREFLTMEEIKRLVETPCYYPELAKMFCFSCFTGLRFSDAKSLKWSQIQFTKELGWFIRFQQKKTKGSETIPLPQSALNIIGSKDEQSENEHVFKNVKSGVWQNLKLKQWALNAGISRISHFTYHISRHSFACLLLQNGADIYTVSKLLGHKDLKTTQIYAKIVDSTKIEAMHKLPVINVDFQTYRDQKLPR